MSTGPGSAERSFAWLARLPVRSPLHWALCLVGAWLAYLVAAVAFSATLIRGPAGVALAIAEMLLALALMPRATAPIGIPRIPASETAIRMLAALAIATAVMLGSQAFGSRVSGVLLAFPITASVLPVFTLALYGADATVRLLAGFVTGLIGFVYIGLIKIRFSQFHITIALRAISIRTQPAVFIRTDTVCTTVIIHRLHIEFIILILIFPDI